MREFKFLMSPFNFWRAFKVVQQSALNACKFSVYLDGANWWHLPLSFFHFLLFNAVVGSILVSALFKKISKITYYFALLPNKSLKFLNFSQICQLSKRTILFPGLQSTRWFYPLRTIAVAHSSTRYLSELTASMTILKYFL